MDRFSSRQQNFLPLFYETYIVSYITFGVLVVVLDPSVASRGR